MRMTVYNSSVLEYVAKEKVPETVFGSFKASVIMIVALSKLYYVQQ